MFLASTLRLCVKLSLSPTMPRVMSWKNSIAVLFVGLLLLISVMARTQKMQRIPAGNWGGQHINIKVGAKSATIEYDCATGVIQGPLVIDRDGNFNLRGTHRMQRGGPVRADETAQDRPATFTGSIKGNTMTLNLKLGDSDVETFTLEKGKEGDLVRCK